MDVWYPSADRSVAGADAGVYTAGPYRLVFHTTEGATSSGAFAAYRNATSWPHFTVSPTSIYQHIPINRAARSLKHPANTIETNRLSCVQIEMVGYAANPPEPGPHLVPLVRWIAAQTGIRLDHHAPFKPYPASYGPNNGVRFTDNQWAAFDGLCGHMNVPRNDHGDPGMFDLSVFLPSSGVTPGPIYEVDPMQIQTVEVTIPTDGDGNGWLKVGYTIDKVLSALPPGLRPGIDGRYGVADIGFAPDGPGVIVSVTGWFPHERAVVRMRVLI